MIAALPRKIANSPRQLLGTFLITMLIATFGYMFAEDASFVNSFYWALVTATTLGYGDFSPHTLVGKILTSCLISFTVFIMIPTITANVASWLIVDRNAFTHDEQEQIKIAVQECVALLKDKGS